MGNTHRTVSIGATDDGFTSLIDQLKNVAGEMYSEIRKQAEDYSNDVDKQAKKIQELLRKEKERTEIMREQNRLMLENRTQQKLEAIDNDPRLGSWMKDQKKKDVKEEHREKMREIEEDARESRLVDKYAKQNYDEDEKYHEEKPEKQSERRGHGFSDGGVSHGVAQGMGLGAMLGMGAAMSAIFGQGTKLQTSMMGLESMTGIRKVANTEHLGMSTADFSDYVKNLAQGSGTNKGVERNALRNLETEKAFGLNEGSLSAFGEHTRMGGVSGGDMARLLINKAANSGLWNIGKGDFSALGEKVEQTNAIMKKEGQFVDKYDGTKSADLLTKLAKLGGGFGDSRALDRLNIIDKGLKGGGNEFLQAQIFQALTSGKDGANMDLYDVRMQQGQGILGKGNFSKVMGNIHGTWGKGSKNLKTNLLQMFPEFIGNHDAINTLANMGDDQIASFANLGGANVKRFIDGVGTGNVGKRGSKFTGTVNQITAGVNNVAGEFGVDTIETLGPTAKAMVGATAEFAKSVKSFTQGVKSFVKADDKTRNTMNDAIQSTEGLPMETKLGSAILTKLVNLLSDGDKNGKELVEIEKKKSADRNKSIPTNNPNGNKTPY